MNAAVLATAALAQTNMFGILDTNTSRVFNAKEIKNREGSVVGARMIFKSQKEMKEALGITDKVELEAAMLKQSDEAFRRAKSHIAGLNGDNTLTTFEVKTLKSGIVQTKMVTRAIPRNHGPTDEAIAKALGIKVEEVAVMRARQLAAINKPAIEVKTV